MYDMYNDYTLPILIYMLTCTSYYLVSICTYQGHTYFSCITQSQVYTSGTLEMHLAESRTIPFCVLLLSRIYCKTVAIYILEG